jgi:tetratricopeptide (TPR) repeat protein
MQFTKTKFAILAIVFSAGLTAVYSNHFDNGFYFDDIHTIVNNEFVRSLDYFPEYFTGIEAFGTMPTNRGYRPIVVLLNAIDYQLAGEELDQTVFHISIWFWYLIQGVLMYMLTLKMFRFCIPDRDMRLASLLTTAFYMFHTVNAETVNYIICRSDSFSTTMMLAGLVLYANDKLRRFHLYLVPFIIAMLTKEVSYMFVPLVVLYHYFFMSNGELKNLFSKREMNKVGDVLKAVLPTIIIGTGLLLFNLVYMTDTSRLSGGLAHPRWEYLSTQFVVISHYISNFILPIDLSADPDFKVTSGFSSEKLIGLIIIGGLLIGGIAALTKKRLLPIGFGILWYFICLAPTSSLNPMYQVANDHRAFLSNIGLCISVGWAVYLLYLKWPKLKIGILVLTALVISGHGYGTYQRNEIWGSNATLWYDVTVKSPKNGRGLMNYGLVKMRNGEYVEAEDYFTKALEFLPYWTYTNVNMAVLKDAVGEKEEAVKYFELGLRYGRDNPEPYYYYARAMLKHGNTDKAAQLLEDGHNISPKHSSINQMRERLRLLGATPEEKLQRELKLVTSSPTSDNYINLSLAQYKQKDYEGCIASCQKALELNPKSAVAYNNICSSYNAMKNWQAAAAACKKALEINPKFERARNNLKWTESKLSPK